MTRAEGSALEAKLLRDIDSLLFGQREFAWVSGGGAVGTYFSQLGCRATPGEIPVGARQASPGPLL